jgi:hypothetical protein
LSLARRMRGPLPLNDAHAGKFEVLAAPVRAVSLFR